MQNPYFRLALGQAARLFSRGDREAWSRTHGSFDRTYWSWKFTDFPGSRFQEAAFALAQFHRLDLPGNPCQGHPLVLEWLHGAIDNWCRLQYRDGSFDEAYPFERSLAATAFTTFYVGEACIAASDTLGEERRDAVKRVMERAADWLCSNDETHGVLSNHLAAAAAALVTAGRFLDTDRYEARAQYFLERIYACQSDEGWYEEYGGADPGYQTHGTFYLAWIWRTTGDERLLASLKRSLAFLKHCVHPDGTVGGEYGSRNTAFFFPAGFEILAPASEDARSIATFMRRHVAAERTVGLSAMDAYNFLPMLNNYLAATAAAGDLGRAEPLPCQQDGSWDFPKAGIALRGRGAHYLVAGLSKGGVVKLFERSGDKAQLVVDDCGWTARLDGKRTVTTQALDHDRASSSDALGFKVSGSFVQVNQKVMNPWLFLLFRGYSLVLGQWRPAAIWVKAILVRALVTRKVETGARFERRIGLSPTELDIEDVFTVPAGKHLDNLRPGGKFSSIHMGSARYFQPSELECRGADAHERTEDRSPDGATVVRVWRRWQLRG